MPKCDYCKIREGKYKFKNGKWCCEKYSSRCPELKKKIIENVSKNRQRRYLIRKIENNDGIILCEYCKQPAYYQFKNRKYCCEDVRMKCPAQRFPGEKMECMENIELKNLRKIIVII